MNFIEGHKIPLTLQLISSDNTYYDTATVKFTIYDADWSQVITKLAVWDSSLNCYKYTVDPSTQWTDQQINNYHITWAVTAGNEFASEYNEELVIHMSSSSSSSSTSSSSSSSSESSSSSSVSSSSSLSIGA